MAKARKAEKEIAAGNHRGPLHGIPYTLKDLIDTDGIRTTYGYSSHQDYVPQRSATVHQRLEEAGAVLVGKVDCHFRRNIPVSCRNPWDLDRSPGISSSGSGASLAASLCLASIGSDTGGSVRIPASWSGVVGLRGTLGLLSRHNALGPSWSFDQLGPLAKTVEDVALIYGVVAGFDPNDPISLRNPVPNYAACLNGDIKGLRVGVLEEFVGANCTEEVEAAMREALSTLEGLGAQLREVTIPHSPESKRVLTVVSEAESAVDYPRFFPKERLDNIDDDLKEYLARGESYTMADYLEGQRMAAILRQELADVFQDVDVIVAPTCLTPAVPISQDRKLIDIRGVKVDYLELLLRVTSIASVTGLPGLSVPCGFDGNGMPIGMQLMGRHLEEARILQVGHAYEQATEWHKARPAL
jgi:aspartyl-tRNA(Asn)/glutamyl-tRNA(Gln) amidotransferase subunit A